MKNILTSFASTDSRYFKYLKDIEIDAKKYFNGAAIYTENNIDKAFFHKNKLLYSMPRGFGYWSWKPYIIYNTLKQLNDNDVCMYVDAGVKIINDPKPLLDLCINEENGILLFFNSLTEEHQKKHINSTWTKRDCFIFMGCDTHEFARAPQADASCQIYMKNNFTMKFIEEYLFWCQNLHVVSDMPNVTKDNYPDFKDHRHDQSILSILIEKYKIKLHPQASQYGDNWRPQNCTYGQIFNHHRGSL